MKLSQLTDAQWINIFKLKENGFTISFIAQRYRIDENNLAKVFKEINK